jgi:hypothetical protein
MLENLAGITSIAGDLFGSSSKQKGRSITESSTLSSLTANTQGETRERLEISDEAIDEIISDSLSGAGGLAEIFAGEQNAGIFNSSVSNQAAGELTANIVGEIAKLRAEKVGTVDTTTTQEEEQTGTQKTNTSSKSGGGGILSGLFG